MNPTNPYDTIQTLRQRVQELEELLKESYKDADEVLRPRVAELEKENSIERNLRIGVEAGFDCANEELGRLKARIENLMLDSEQWRTDCHTYCDAMHKREAEILSLQAERDNWKQVAQNNHDRLVDVQVELELSDALQRDKVAKLTAERDELLEVVETAYKVASEHDDRLPFDWSVYCEMLYQTIASVKEKA